MKIAMVGGEIEVSDEAYEHESIGLAHDVTFRNLALGTESTLALDTETAHQLAEALGGHTACDGCGEDFKWCDSVRHRHCS